MKFLTSLFSAFLMLMVLPVSAQQAGLLKPGDAVQIELKTPAEDASTFGTLYAVSDRGTIKMPMLEQEIPAVGISTSTLARRIEAAYKAAQIYTAPMINATLPVVEGGMPNHVVTVSGEVRASGEFPLRQGMTLMTAISKAGGFTEFGDPKKVKLLRANREQIFNMKKILPDGSNNPVLQDGDQIIVSP
jgi:protein involved in polysaccharide export with SLBB domain